MKKLKLVLLIFNSFVLWSQEGNQKLIHCRVYADSASVEGINVLNMVNERTATTDKNGEFFILAKEEDLLRLTAVNLEIKRKLIESEDLDLEIITIKMIPKITKLKEVIVNENSQINAVNLGIVPKGMKSYTPAERRYYTATSTPIDALLNLISGRTAMLKKEIIAENKERLIVKLDGLFEDQYYIEELKIPEEYIKGFQYYLIEDNEFVNALLAKNKTLLNFLMPKLALNYNQLLNYEK